MDPVDDSRAERPSLLEWAPIPRESNFDDDAGPVVVDDAADDGEGAAAVAAVAVGARDRTLQPKIRLDSEWWCKDILGYHNIHHPS